MLRSRISVTFAWVSELYKGPFFFVQALSKIHNMSNSTPDSEEVLLQWFTLCQHDDFFSLTKEQQVRLLRNFPRMTWWLNMRGGQHGWLPRAAEDLITDQECLRDSGVPPMYNTPPPYMETLAEPQPNSQDENIDELSSIS